MKCTLQLAGSKRQKISTGGSWMGDALVSTKFIELPLCTENLFRCYMGEIKSAASGLDDHTN